MLAQRFRGRMAGLRAVVSGLHRQSDFELSGSLKGKQGDLGHSFIRRCLRRQIPRVDQGRVPGGGV